MKIKMLSALMTVITTALLGVASASAAAFDVQVQGHLTRPQVFCPSGDMLCGTANIERYGQAEYGWSLIGSTEPSGSCGPHAGLFDYAALVKFTLRDGSKLTMREAGTLCSPGNSFPTDGPNSYGNPRFFDAQWDVVSATGQFAGFIGKGASRGAFAGAAVNARYSGTLEMGSNDATLSLGWDIVQNGEPVTCESVGATHLRVLLRGTGSTTEMEFDCNQKSAEFIINAGTYSVEIDLVDIEGTPLNSVPVVSTVEIFIGEVYYLGYYEFSFQL